LFAEALAAAVENQDSQLAEEIYERASEEVRAHPRIQLTRVRQLLQSGDAAGAQALLDVGIELAGVREGANLLAEYWLWAQRELGTDRPVPARYEFGMFGDS
jgi:hypothetical protein